MRRLCFSPKPLVQRGDWSQEVLLARAPSGFARIQGRASPAPNRDWPWGRLLSARGWQPKRAPLQNEGTERKKNLETPFLRRSERLQSDLGYFQRFLLLDASRYPGITLRRMSRRRRPGVGPGESAASRAPLTGLLRALENFPRRKVGGRDNTSKKRSLKRCLRRMATENAESQSPV